MGLNLGGTTITKSGTDLVIGRTNTALTLDSSGRLIRGGIQPLFYATSNSEWTVIQSGAGWAQHTFNGTEVNRNSCFSTSTSNFTAPCDGVYLFTASAYHDDTVAVTYIHPLFAVNGAVAGRMPYTTAYRIRHAAAVTGYAFDGQISQLYYLYANDYVSYYAYCAGGTLRSLKNASHFAGYLLG